MEYRFNTLLTRTAHVSQNYLRPYLDELGLSVGQPKVLRCLTALGPCSQRVLADCCEAAVRSLGDCTREAREATVHKVIWSKLTDGAENLLSNAPLTFHELTEIERSFLRTFSGIMHDRIEYPEEKKP